MRTRIIFFGLFCFWMAGCGTVRQMRSQIEASSQAVSENIQAVEASTAAITANQKAIREITTSLEDAAEAMRKTTESLEASSRAVTAATESIQANQKAVEESTRAIEANQKAIEQSTKAIERTMEKLKPVLLLTEQGHFPWKILAAVGAFLLTVLVMPNILLLLLVMRTVKRTKETISENKTKPALHPGHGQTK